MHRLHFEKDLPIHLGQRRACREFNHLLIADVAHPASSMIGFYLKYHGSFMLILMFHVLGLVCIRSLKEGSEARLMRQATRSVCRAEHPTD